MLTNAQGRQGTKQGVYSSPGAAGPKEAALVAAGATALDLAIAMIGIGMSLSPDPNPLKHGEHDACANPSNPTDSSNPCALTFGLFNNGWRQITQACTPCLGLNESQEAQGLPLIRSADDALAIQCQHQQMADPLFGNGGDLTRWVVAQTAGISGYND